MADGDSLRSVFTNLVVNALEAMNGEGGKFNQTVERSNSVKGKSLTADVGLAQKTFQKSLSHTFRRKNRTGLGLAIVKKPSMITAGQLV